MRRGSILSELIMRGGGVRSILLLPIVTRCLETIDLCIWRTFVFYVCCSDGVGVCVNVCCVAAVVKNSGFLCLGVLKYVLCLCSVCVMDVVFSVCIVRRGAVDVCVWEV